MAPGAVLFLCLFASQAAIIVLAPTLSDVAAEFGISTAAAGQLRAVTGLVAGVSAVAIGVAARRPSLRDLLSAGLVLLCLGSLISAVAPTFLVLAAAQIAVGIGIGTVVSSGIAASADWARPERRVATLSVALMGQPVAWIIGIPAVGAASQVSWRLGWILVPFASSLLGLVAVRLRPADVRVERSPGSWMLVARRRDIRGWAIGELLAYAGWSGALVYAGALFAESYGVSAGQVGLLLGVGAVAYLPGNFLARRWVGSDCRHWLAVLALIAALQATLFGALRQGLWLSAVLFGLLAFTGGARTLAGSTAGLTAAPLHRLEVMSIRAAATQFGYLLGASLGGAAIAAAGYAGLAVVLSLLFVGAAVPHLGSARSTRVRPSPNERVHAWTSVPTCR